MFVQYPLPHSLPLTVWNRSDLLSWAGDHPKKSKLLLGHTSMYILPLKNQSQWLTHGGSPTCRECTMKLNKGPEQVLCYVWRRRVPSPSSHIQYIRCLTSAKPPLPRVLNGAACNTKIYADLSFLCMIRTSTSFLGTPLSKGLTEIV